MIRFNVKQKLTYLDADHMSQVVLITRVLKGMRVRANNKNQLM